MYNKPPAAASHSPPLLLKVQFVVSVGEGGGVRGRSGGGGGQCSPEDAGASRRDAGRLFIFPFERAGVLSQPRREPIASPSLRQRRRPLEESGAVLSPRGIVCQTHKRGSNISAALCYAAGLQKLGVWEQYEKKKYGSREGKEKKISGSEYYWQIK